MAATLSPARTARHFVAHATTIAMFAALALAAAFHAPRAHAADDDDLPARVGRVADVGGALYLAPEDRASEWAEIGLNYPVTGGDNLWVSGEGRAEVDVGAGQFRLAGNTNVHVSRIDDHDVSIFIAQGRMIFSLRYLEPGDTARIDTPNTQIGLLRPGLYRVDVSDDRLETTLVVREGEASAAVSGGAQQVLPGQTATLFGDRDVQADVRNGTGLDGFDTWSADRDRYYRRGRSATYVSPQMVGAADLDAYGTWQTEGEYGAVWFPTSVAVGWAPYRYGRWTTLPGWGLTWVDDAPWGYAPFHYGRWVFVGGRGWGWCPGRYVARPTWAPALVAWYGGGGIAVGGYGPVYGWVPLGWREPYVPAWRNCSNRCWSGYNRPYAVNVAERPRQPPTYYANAQVPGAITAVPGAAFAAGKPVAPNRVSLPNAQMAGVPPLAAPPQIKPLPIAANSVRPGNGVPVPASSAFGATKPRAVTPERPITSAPGAPARAVPSSSGRAYNGTESPRTGVEALPNRAPAQITAEVPRGAPTSAPGAPMRVAPAPRAPVTSAPPAPMRAAPPPQQAPAAAEASAPVRVAPAPVVPPSQAVAPPHAAPPAAVADKPAPGKPAPVPVPN
jgi:hypothetical protein